MCQVIAGISAVKEEVTNDKYGLLGTKKTLKNKLIDIDVMYKNTCFQISSPTKNLSQIIFVFWQLFVSTFIKAMRHSKLPLISRDLDPRSIIFVLHHPVSIR